MRESLVLPPLMTSPPQSTPQHGGQLLDSFHNYHRKSAGAEAHFAGGRTHGGMPAGNSSSGSSSLGHSPASVAASPASMPSPLLAPATSSRARGKSPERRVDAGRKGEVKMEQGMKIEQGAGGDDIITLFPRRKAGQTRPGGGRGPVVLNLELLEKFYGMPLHVAASRLVSHGSGYILLSWHLL